MTIRVFYEEIKCVGLPDMGNMFGEKSARAEQAMIVVYVISVDLRTEQKLAI
jgi:hypothetical protein